ncbi:biopolymer transport protein ExbD [Onishia taeanensis]|jgi:biopolymer transport protein ExbD|uniref:Biopolymer transport protein ExbD n=1 Tax=Onishia taeanensis TaxID=284577 RepID=A0A1G7R860_9GAMM|nr:biopolymer transporter ExbD [Halomonas taeanensis]SDG06180.1 biopolymer transport protein ExbD [Halomonas taeanensis]
MKFPRRHREPVEINLTPLIDVVFLLLIFFMVSTTFETRQALELELPESASAAPAETAPVVLSITAEGDYRLDQISVDQHDLAAALTTRADAAREHGLVIEADGRVAHRRVVAALDQAAALGITRVRIATREANDSSNQAETP